MLKWIFLICSSSFLIASSFFPKAYSLDGIWSYHIENMPQAQTYVYDFKGKEPQIQLPNNWYKQGINHAGVIWFERTVDMKSLPLASNYFLHFTGVDYLCDIWVNNQYVGSHQGYFQTFDFNISPFLHKGENKIKVKVNSPLENYPEHYSLHKTLLRGIFSHHDTRPGGAWTAKGQDKNSGGIWNHISILGYQQYKFDKIKFTPVIKNNQVDLNIKGFINKLEQKSHASFLYLYSLYTHNNTRLKVTLTPYNFKGKSYQKIFNIKNKNLLDLTMPLKDAKLWYTYDRGYPHLYTIKLTFGKTQLRQQIGFKSLTQDSNGTYYLNNTPLYLKGTNYISSQYMSEMSKKMFKKDLELMKEAHINTIRVHAHIEPTRFYTLCDEMGFLLWQDYNLQWGYIDTPAFENEAIKQARQMVDLLYNHPSIYIWSMHNEPPWNSEWMKWKYSDYNASINKTLDEKLYQNIQDYDTYHLSKMLSSNLEHPWFGWYSGKYTDFNATSKVPVITEYGAQAIPNLSSLKKFIPKQYLLPKSKKAKKVWEYHNYQFNWSEKNGVKFKNSLKQLIKDSQTYQADLIKYATEMLRIQKYRGTTAIFQFMFNEGWPSMNWGVIDYYRQKKLGFTALKRAFAPILVVTKQTKEDMLEFYIINDTLKTIQNANLQVTIHTNLAKHNYIYPVNILADSVTKVAKVSLLKESNITMKLFKDNNHTLLTDNFYHLKPLLIPKKENHE
jgi:beta-mannosidase